MVIPTQSCVTPCWSYQYGLPPYYPMPWGYWPYSVPLPYWPQPVPYWQGNWSIGIGTSNATEMSDSNG